MVEMLGRQARLYAILDAVQDATVVVDERLTIAHFNAAAARLFGHEPHEVAGKHHDMLLPPRFRAEHGERMRRFFQSGGREPGIQAHEVPAQRKNGEEFPAELSVSLVEIGGETHALAVLRDISARKHAEADLRMAVHDAVDARARLELTVRELERARERERHAARHDVLADLPNRKLFLEQLERDVARSRLREETLGLLWINIDRFGGINDSLGHGAGDEVLRLAAGRVRVSLRGGDFAARLGGDEFAVLLQGADEHEAIAAARWLLERIAAPHLLRGQEVLLTASIGIAFYPTDAMDAEALLKNAHISMYRAKEQGGNTFEFYTSSMGVAAQRRLELESSLHRALSRDELTLHYQPLVSLGSGELVGVEALVRWQHPSRGLVAPDDFIPLAEESGLIFPVGEWVVRRAAEQQQRWQADGLNVPRTAVNLSVRQFRQPGLADVLSAAMKQAGVASHQMAIEITEAAAVEDPTHAAEILGRLRRRGMQVSIDDFGVGYSSLSHLRDLPVDALKIDRSFVRGCGAGGGPDEAVVRAIIAMARELGLQVVAEGVEEECQLDALRELGCDVAQGFLLCRPEPAERLTEMLRAGVSFLPRGD